MKLKPNSPWIAFIVLGLMIYLGTKLIQLAFDKNDLILIIPALLLLTIGLLAIVWTNKDYRTYELTDKLKFKGYFWGISEIELRQLNGFRIKERREGRYLVTVFDIVLSIGPEKELIIRESNYGESSINAFKNILTEKGIEFKGLEHFSWRKSFQDLLRLKWLE